MNNRRAVVIKSTEYFDILNAYVILTYIIYDGLGAMENV